MTRTAAHSDPRPTQAPGKTKDVTLKDISKALAQDPERYATHVIGAEPTWRSGGSVRYYENQSLVVFTSGSYRGRFKWFPDESVKGDMLDLTKFIKGCDTHAAAEEAKSYLGAGGQAIEAATALPGKDPEILEAEERERNAKRIRTAQWLWNRASETEGREDGLAYLRNRGITADIPSSALRFRRISRKELIERLNVVPGDVPEAPVTALVFGARNAEGEITAVQQIFTAAGKKVDFPNPKRTNGLINESAVWLGDPSSSDTAIMAEGPETGCSLHQATRLPVCITLGTSNFTRVHLPRNIKTLVTATDMEPTGIGLASALRAAQTWRDRGIERSGIAVPKLNDGDFNDVHQQQGESAVRQAVTRAYFPAERPQDGTVLVTADARAAFYAWVTTGLEVAPKVPPRKPQASGGPKIFSPLHLDSVVDRSHNRVLLVKTPGITIEDEGLRRNRPDVEIVTLHEDSRDFRKLARTPNAVNEMIRALDLYAPEGLGEREPAFFSLRRADADALKLDGYRSIAIRSSALDRTDLSFMKGREAFVAPVGNGTCKDADLTRRLEEAGARVTRLTWQLFPGQTGDRPLLRREVPENFGAAQAAREGWTGKALEELVTISKANRKQMRIEEMARSAIADRAATETREEGAR